MAERKSVVRPDGSDPGSASPATKAAEMLERIKPFDRWATTLPDSLRQAIQQEFGSLTACYEFVVGALKREADEPSPRSAGQTARGVRVSW